MHNLWPILAILLGLLTPWKAVADDWPQWRGPGRDGVWRETGVFNKFPAKRLATKWEVPISSGYSGPTVAQGRVYVTDRLLQPMQQERVLCFDAETGKSLWQFRYDCPYEKVSYTAGPRASVTIDNGKAYSLGTMGHLFCLDAASGDLLWQHDCNKEFRIQMPIWGIAASPLVYKELLIVQIGGKDATLAAFDKNSGKLVWKALSDRASYSAPILHRQAGQDVLICWTGDNVAALKPETGKLLWKHPFKPTRMVIGIATPVIDQDRLFVTSFYDGSLMLRLSENQLAAEEVWRRRGPDERNTDSLHSIIATPLLRGDHVYGVDSYGELRCLEAKTGDRIWESQQATPRARWSNIHMVTNGDKVWMFNERGELIIAELSPTGYQEIDRAKLIDPTTVQLRRRDGVCWSHPAFANRHVFARNDEKLVCASLAKE